MSKYDPLWEYIQKNGESPLILSFTDIHNISGIPIDHSFLTYKKELLNYGYQVKKISMKKQNVLFMKQDE